MNQKYIDSYTEGEIGESKFKTLAESRGFRVENSSKNENIYKHIDFYLFKNEKKISFDIKAKKRMNRANSGYSDDAVWVEIKNVHGSNGWIQGQQEYIAFEFSDEFIVVKRLDLEMHIYSIVDFSSPIVSSPKDAYKRLYQRKGRLDLITIINKKDLLEIPNRTWDK